VELARDPPALLLLRCEGLAQQALAGSLSFLRRFEQIGVLHRDADEAGEGHQQVPAR
jgi:hypothetical protein